MAAPIVGEKSIGVPGNDSGISKAFSDIASARQPRSSTAAR
jgi:hypothetical protein